MAGLPIVDMDDMYNLAKEIATAADLSPDKFFTDPATVEPQPPGPDYTLMALEIEGQKAANQARDTEVEAEVDKYQSDLSAEVDKYKADLQAQTQVYLAQIKAGQQVDLEQIKATLKNEPIERANAQKAKSDGDMLKATKEANATMAESLRQMMQELQVAMEKASGPKRVVRDEKGNVIGVEPSK